MLNTDVNGWENRQTWNVALWIRNTDTLYDKACDFAKMCRVHGKKATYREFISYAHLDHGRTTPDGISWTGKLLDHSALDQMLSDLVN